MAKDFDSSEDIRSDIGSDVGNGTGSDFGGDLASDDGVDLNAGDVSKADNAKEGFAKAMQYEALPPTDYTAAAVFEPVPAIYQEVPEDRDPSQWEERLQNLFNFGEDLGGAIRGMQEDENNRNEAEEADHALNSPLAADNCDPPEPPQSESVELVDAEMSIDNFDTEEKN